MTEPFDDVGADVEGDQTLTNGSGFEDIYAAMRREHDEQFEAYRKYAGGELYAKHLAAAFDSFNAAEDLKVGELVQWKTFLRNAEYPDYGAPAIVVGFQDHHESVERTPFDRQDVILGVLDHDQDLRLVATDRRRLMTWVPRNSE